MRNTFLAVCLLLPVHISAATLHVPGGYSSIQDAVSASSSGDTVLVAAGNYAESFSFQGKAIVVRSEAGPTATYLNGSSSSVVTFSSNEGQDSVLEGFTIRYGSGTASGGSRYGGAIYCQGSGPTIRGNRILNNTAGSWSDAAYGGGIYCNLDGDTIVLSHNIIAENTASVGDNTGSEFAYGGGICVVGSGTALIHNNVIYSNTAHVQSYQGDSYGGGIYHSGPACLLENNTLAYNTVSGGIHLGPSLYAGVECELTNSIVWADWGTPVEGDVSDVTYSNVFGGFTGVGNVSVDPSFEAGGLSGYHLSSGSSCIDAGNPDPVCNDAEDPDYPGYPLWPALGFLLNDMGAYGGPGVAYWAEDPSGNAAEEAASICAPVSVSLFPNPFCEDLNITCFAEKSQTITVSVYDNAGRIVDTVFDGNLPAGFSSIIWIPQAGVPSGTYIVHFLGEGLRVTDRCLLINR